MTVSAGLIGLSFVFAGLAFLALVARLMHPHTGSSRRPSMGWAGSRSWRRWGVTGASWR